MSASLSGNLQGAWRRGWSQRLVTFLLWALAAWSAAFWALRLATPTFVAPGAVPVVGPPEPVEPQVVARLLGATATRPEVAAGPRASSLVLAGVVAARSGAGSALIAVDGSPPRPYRVGMRVQEDLWLLSVQPRHAQLGPSPQGPPTLTLDLPAPIRAELGGGDPEARDLELRDPEGRRPDPQLRRKSR